MIIIIPIVLFAAGWFVGAVINYLADQLPADEKHTGAVCGHCKSRIGWGRYLALIRCPACGKRRTYRSFVVELFFSLFAVVLWQFPYPRLPFILIYLLIAYFGLVSVIDLEHRLIFWSVSLAGFAIGITEGWILHGLAISLLGGLAGTLIMLGLYWVGRWFSKMLSRRRGQEVDEEALGFGDVYVSGIIGLVLGWPGITAGLLLGILIGGVISGIFLLVMKISRRYQPLTALPYAPYLIAAALILLFRPV